MSKVLIISPIVPDVHPANAGEKLVLNHALGLIELGHEVFFLSTSGNFNLSKETKFEKYILSTYSETQTSLEKLIGKIRRPISSWTPNIEFIISILANWKCLKKIRESDIIDLQWAEMVFLAPVIKLINPRAKLIGTLHDINSQKFFRRYFFEKNLPKRKYWLIQYYLSNFFEIKIIDILDFTIVLSDKDRSLVDPYSNSKSIKVVSPPIYSEDDNFEIFQKELNPTPTIVFLGSMTRWENLDAVQWLLVHVMPSVWKIYPNTIVKIVGSVGDISQIEGAQDEHVQFTGIIENLVDAFVDAWISVVPLRLGAGVKFKTIDALQFATPVVTTRVGVEGIGDITWVAKIADSSSKFAEAINNILSDMGEYNFRAINKSKHIREFYSKNNYLKLIKAIYE